MESQDSEPRPAAAPDPERELTPEDWAKIEERASKEFDLVKRVLELSRQKKP